MTHQQAADPAALKVLFDDEAQFGAALRGDGGAADEIARSANDDLLLARADGYQQRDCPLEICPRDPTEFGVTDIGLITKEPCVDRVRLRLRKARRILAPSLAPAARTVTTVPSPSVSANT